MAALIDIPRLLDWAWPKLAKTWQAWFRRRRDALESRKQLVLENEELRRRIEMLEQEVQRLQEISDTKDEHIRVLSNYNDELRRYVEELGESGASTDDAKKSKV